MKTFTHHFLLLVTVVVAGCRDAQYEDNIHLNFISLPLANYRQAYGHMPTNIVDKQGNLLFSWRVTLLKFGNELEVKLYKQFKLDEPWNSPYNLKVAQTVPFYYIDPRGGKCRPVDPGPQSVLWTMDPEKPNYTPYLGVVGERAAFRPGRPRQAKTYIPEHAMIVVVDKSDVIWTEPRDISLEKAKRGDSLRWYGEENLYLSDNGSVVKWDRKKNDIENRPPNYEYESDE
jgi:hypothetical protein